MHRWSSLQHRLVHGIGRLTTAPSSCMQHPKERTEPEDKPGGPKRTNRLGWVSKAAPQIKTIKPAQKTERKRPARAETKRVS